MNKFHLLSAVCICLLSFSTNASMVTGGGFASEDYAFFPSPTAWDPGEDTARMNGFPAPGGATWSIMGAGISDASDLDTHNDYSTTAMTALPGLDGITATDIASTIDKAFNVWASVSGFTNLGQVDDSRAGMGDTDANGGNIGDIRIGAIYIDGEPETSDKLAHSWQPGTNYFGPGYNILGDVHFDGSNSWYISDLNGEEFGTGYFDLLTVMIHELGHALGLTHSTVEESIMYQYYGGVHTALHADDIAGIQAIYGASTSPVPVPAAVWLFGSGLLGLIGIARRKKV